MDTPIEEQQMFTHITKFSSSEATGEIPGLGSLTLDTIHEVQTLSMHVYVPLNNNKIKNFSVFQFLKTM